MSNIITPLYSLQHEETERLSFRLLQHSDFDTWLEFCKDPASTKFIFDNNEESPEEKCRIWFNKTLTRYETQRGSMNVLIDKASGSFTGQCGLLIQTVDGIDELEIGYSLMPAHRGKGYAIEAALKCRDYAFENNITGSLISIINPDNHNSARVALKNGMRLDKTTLFSNTPVNIFRITKDEWLARLI